MIKKNISLIVLTVFIFCLTTVSSSAASNIEQSSYNNTSAVHYDFLEKTNSSQSKLNSQTSLASATSISSDIGGTLLLDYVGDINPISDSIYTSIVYLPATQVVFLQNAIHSETICDYISSEFIDKGISIITHSVAILIASHLGITPTIVEGIIGTSIIFTYWCLSNIEKWDLSNAISESTTGKIKIVSFYNINSFSSTPYMEFDIFEAWNTSDIEIPEDYDYVWLEGIYADTIGDPNCTHTYSNFSSQNSVEHASACVYCGNVEIFEHNYQTGASVNVSYHKTICVDCGHSKNERHLCVWEPQDSYVHIGECSLCGFLKTGFHSENYNQILGICSTCGFKGAIALRSIHTKTTYVRE